MSFNKSNIFDDTKLEFPRIGFWLIHIFGAVFLVSLGMRMAVKKAPLPIIAYRLFKSMR